jgi:uncharacterized membrane protein
LAKRLIIMSLPVSMLLLSLANLALWVFVPFVSGVFFPKTCPWLYTSTVLWQRAAITGVVYSFAVVGFNLPFQYHSAAAGFLQSLFNPGFIIMMAATVGNKEINWLVYVAAGTCVLSALFLLYALALSPTRAPVL